MLWVKERVTEREIERTNRMSNKYQMKHENHAECVFVSANRRGVRRGKMWAARKRQEKTNSNRRKCKGLENIIAGR